MHDFDYEAPTNLSEAVSLMEQYKESARPLAGGTDLIDQMRIGKRLPQVVVDVKKIPELTQITETDDSLLIGAAVNCERLSRTPLIGDRFSALSDSCKIIGGVQIQSRASVGGNLCNSGPAADSIPSLMVFGAECQLHSVRGLRSIPIAEFCTAPGKNVLADDELLVAIRLPLPATGTGSHYRRLIPRNEMDIAVVGVAARVTLNESGESIAEASIALAAVAPTPVLAMAAGEFLQGRELSGQVFQQAGELAREAIQPIDDMRGTASYRKQITGVLVRRALESATARAQGKSVDYRPGFS